MYFVEGSMVAYWKRECISLVRAITEQEMEEGYNNPARSPVAFVKGSDRG